MIARVWRARTAGAEDTERYHRVFEDEVVGTLDPVAGFQGAYLLTRSGTEIRALTLFESLDSVRGFSGEAYETERVTPAARATLLQSDPVIRHYTVLTEFRASRTS